MILFIIGFFFFAQNICVAADPNPTDSDSDIDAPLSQTHKYEPSEGIWYPKKYENYQDFKAERLVSFLSDRLEMLFKLKNESKSWSEGEFVYHKMERARNEIFLMNNLDVNGIRAIFGKTYDRENISDNHTIDVAAYLKTRFPDDPDVQKDLDDLIAKILPPKEERGSASEMVSNSNPQAAQFLPAPQCFEDIIPSGQAVWSASSDFDPQDLKEHLITLLDKRLGFLCKIFDDTNPLSPKDLEILKKELEVNEILIHNTAKISNVQGDWQKISVPDLGDQNHAKHALDTVVGRLIDLLPQNDPDRQDLLDAKEEIRQANDKIQQTIDRRLEKSHAEGVE